jgi:hypothetical protein
MKRSNPGLANGEVPEVEYEDEWDYYSEDEDLKKK